MSEASIKIKQALKYQRWQYRRLAAQRKHGKEIFQAAPIIFGNSIPKAGSHLISQVLRGMTQLGPFVDNGFPSVNRDQANRNLPDERILANFNLLKPGDIGYGKVTCKPPFIKALTKEGMATVFIYRDPRDLAVSIIRYATDIHKGHGLHQHFTEVLKTDEERLHFVIAGSNIPNLSYLSLIDRYTDFYKWLEQPILSIKFEDLIENRRETLSRILNFIAEKGFRPTILHEEAVTVLEQSIQPKRSGTFRKGKPGEWRSVYSESTKVLFKETTGDLLQRLGYEKDRDW